LKTTHLSGKFKASAVDAGFYGAFGQMQLVGDFLIREFLEVAEHHGLAQVGGSSASAWRMRTRRSICSNSP
jgi:hypothetical protein